MESMKLLYITMVSATLSVFVFFMQKNKTNALVQENVEALSYDSENGIKRVSEIIERFEENVIKQPDSIDKNGHVITWKNIVTSITHTVQCAPTEGMLICKSRKDIHSKDYPEECPNANQ